MWFFAPPCAWTRFPLAAARSYTCFAMGVLPTKEIPSIPSWSSSAFTVSGPPFTSWTTPSGKPASSISSKSRSGTSGSCSLGLSTNALPVATAYGRNHNGIMPGKLNGVIAANTPSGLRTALSSIPGAAFRSVPPWLIDGMPQATSTFSIPRRSSPRASASVFPWSSTSVSARSSWCVSSSVFSRNNGWMRSSTGREDHDSNASAPRSTATSTSAGELNGTLAIVSSVAGFFDSRCSSPSGVVHSPPT